MKTVVCDAPELLYVSLFNAIFHSSKNVMINQSHAYTDYKDPVLNEEQYKLVDAARKTF